MKKKILGKRILALLLVVLSLTVGLLTGCGKKTEAPEDSVEEEPARLEPAPIVEPDGMVETMKKYDDVYGWIEIPGSGERDDTGTDLSYPIVQHPTDRLFYLDHNLDGAKSQPGVIFSEKEVTDSNGNTKPCNGLDFNDPVTILYGHNQRNRTMFGGLQIVMKTYDFDDPLYIYIYQENRRITYQIVGGVQYDTSHILYYHDMTDDEVFDNFFSTLWQETDSTTRLDKDNMPVHGDKVLLLSVCKNGDDNHRYLVVGKMIEDTDDPETWQLATQEDIDSGIAVKPSESEMGKKSAETTAQSAPKTTEDKKLA